MPKFANFLIERIFLWLALGIVLSASYVYFVVAPYLGFDYVSSGTIMRIWGASNSSDLKSNDVIVAVNGIEYTGMAPALLARLLSSAKPGEQILFTVIRAGDQRFDVDWLVPGFTFTELIYRFANFSWIAFVFWAAALATVLLVRPKDRNWRLLIAFFLITAIWLSTGTIPGVDATKLYIVFESAVWLTIPIYLHLHWNFPQSLGTLPRWLPWLLYALCLPLIGLEVLEIMPHHTYYVGGLISVAGTCVLVFVRFWIRPEDRNSVRVMLAGVAVSFLPLLLPIVTKLLKIDSATLVMVTMGLPMLPIAYFYMAYRYQLGAMELRANRLIALYLYFLIILVVAPVLFFAVNQLSRDTTFQALGTLVVVTVTVMASIAIFPRFQRLVETHLLGMPLPPERLLHTYAERISATSDFVGLTKILRNDVLPSMLIRQSLLCRWDNRSCSLVDKLGIDDTHLPAPEDVFILLPHAQKYLPVQNSPLAVLAPHLAWIRLILPLRFNGDVIGFWFLGARDPDDFYNHTEIEVLASLAWQTAVAVSNIIQTEQLRLIYQANVERHELERKKLALMLHDQVLNRQAQILWDLPPEAITPQIDSIYRSLTGQVRQIILELRPPLLEYGLHMALEQLIENYLERHPAADLNFDVADSDHRYPHNVEEHIFRIVQQALDNALVHTTGASICLSGHLGPGAIDLHVRDDGDGFEMANMDLHRLLTDHRFGLIGMQERASLIGADLQIRSAPGAGTTVSLTWRTEDHAVPRPDTPSTR